MKYVYPKLPGAYDLWLCRVGGHGLANCLFVYAKAIVTAVVNGYTMLAPTWDNFSIGTYIRKERDKRHYTGIFNSRNEVAGIKRLIILLLFRKKIVVEEGIYDFFQPLLEHHALIRSYLLSHINADVIKDVNPKSLADCIAVHVRLGDFDETRRTPLSWYKEKICSESFYGKKILVFSDGTDAELSELLALPNVQRVFYGNAVADMYAMSCCSYIIGSNSSFSAWASFLGQVPCCFRKLQFGYLLLNKSEQIIEEF